MNFKETEIPGVIVVEPGVAEDHRGSFERTWCREEFAAHGIVRLPDQCSVSFSHRTGTLRGLHYQIDPHAEAKLIRCNAGRIFDVVVDIRPESPTYGRWRAMEMSPRERRMIYVPEGCAHGFQTLEDDTEVFYQIAGPYCAKAQRGVRWDDPELAIRWPIPDPILSEKDRALPGLAQCERPRGHYRAPGPEGGAPFDPRNARPRPGHGPANAG